MSLLVTGGAGFIGSNFVRRWRERNDQALVVLDALTYAGNFASIAEVPGIVFVHGDICDGELVARTMREHGVDRVVHFAAESHVDRSILGPLAFVHTNVVGTATLLDCARAHGVARFVHVSTDEVYGDLGPADPAFEEGTPVRPRSPYSASKASSDHLASAFFHTYGLPVVITRCSNNYGPFQFPEKLIPLMILNALQDKPLPVYGDGQNVRDWLHVEDHCEAIERVLAGGRPGQIYNIGGNAERTNLDIVRRILRLLDRPESLIRFVADRPGHDRRYAIDAAKIRRELDWQPRHSFDGGIEETVRWYCTNSGWCDQVRSGEYRSWYERNYGDRAHAAAAGREPLKQS